MPHQARAYHDFHYHSCIKQQGVFLLPLDGMLVHCLTLSTKFADTHLYTWLQRDNEPNKGWFSLDHKVWSHKQNQKKMETF